MYAPPSTEPPSPFERSISERILHQEAATVPAPARRSVCLGEWDGVHWLCVQHDNESEQQWMQRAAEALCALIRNKAS